MATYNNKRTKTTRFLLRKSLFELLEDYNILDINVTMVCDKAQINRSTFYLHYKSINDLLETIKKEEISLFETFTSSIDKMYTAKSACIQYFEYIKNNDMVYRILLNGKHSDFEREFVDCLQKTTLPDSIAENSYYTNLFSIAGCLQITKAWIENDYPESFEEISDILLKIVNKLK